MFSRYIQIIFATLICLTFVFGCTGEEDEVNKVKEIKLSEGQSGTNSDSCLEDFSGEMSRIVKSEIKPDELAAFWGCVENTIRMFGRYVEGETPGKYTDEELRTYIENNFMKNSENKTISNELLSGMMGVKRVFMGGTEKTITENELKRGVKFVRLLGGMTYRALPYMKIYFKDFSNDKSIKEFTDQEVEKSLVILKEISDDFASWVNKDPQAYGFLEFENFLKAWSKSFPKQEDGKTSLNDFMEYIPLLQSLKVVLIGEDKSKILDHQWTEFFNVFNQGLNVLIRFNYYIGGNQTSLDTHNFKYVDNMVLSIFEMLKQGLEVHEDKTIPHSEMGDVIADLSYQLEFPLGLTSESIRKLWEAVVDYGLKPLNQDERDPNIKGLTESHLEELRTEYKYWFETQMYLNSLVSEDKSMPPTKNKDIRKDAIKQVQRIVGSGVPLLLDDESRVYLDPLDSKVAYDFKSFFTLNWQRAIMRILIRGFSKNENSRRNAISLRRSELTNAAKDLKDLLEALGVAKASDSAFETSKTIHQLVSIFMPHSRGESDLSLAEGIEYLSFIFSGIEAGGPLYKDAEQNCLINKSKRTVSAKCYREIFQRRFNEFVVHMPRFVEFFSGLNADEKLEFQIALEDSVREEGYSDSDMLEGDINKSFILLHYIEVYLIRFDKDKSSVITRKEALDAFPIFKEVLEEVIDEQKLTGRLSKRLDKRSLNKSEEYNRLNEYEKSQIQDFASELKDNNIEILKDRKERCVYMWLLIKGTVPTPNVNFAIWCVFKKGWKKMSSNRIRLTQVLSALNNTDKM